MAIYLQDAQRQQPDVEKYLISPLGQQLEVAGQPVEIVHNEQYLLRQLWTLVKMLRTARRSLRSNAAMYAYLKSIFPYADFRDVKKDNKWGSGLQISLRTPDGRLITDDGDEEHPDDQIGEAMA